MIACVDVDYRGEGAVAACAVARDWADAEPMAEYHLPLAAVEPYVPGQFFRRELPCLLAVLGVMREPADVVIVDGYVWLGDAPGLGAHLYDALGRRVAVVGVAKTRYAAAGAREVVRGGGRRPLYITAAGIDLDTAARQVAQMHGPYRIPTLLRRVDQLCRRAAIR